MRRILAGILLLAASTWARDTYQGPYEDPSSSQDKPRIIACTFGTPYFDPKNDQEGEDKFEDYVPITDSNTGHHGTFTANQGGLIIGSTSGGPFGLNQGNVHQGGLFTGSNTGGPFVTKDYLGTEDKSEDYVPITGSNEGYFGASNTNPGGLISGLNAGGPFGVNQGNYPQGGLFPGSNTGGPFVIKNYQQGASSTNQGGLSSGSNSEIPSLTGGYPGLTYTGSNEGYFGASNTNPGGLISGLNSGGPFGVNQGNYAQGGLFTGSNTGGPFVIKNDQEGASSTNQGGLSSGSNSEIPSLTGGYPGLTYTGSNEGYFGASNTNPGGLISGLNSGGPFGVNQGNYAQGGLFTESNTGGPFVIKNYQEGASSTNQGGLSSGSNSEIPSLTGGYPGLRNDQLSGLDSFRNQFRQGGLTRGNHIEGPFITGAYLGPILGQQSEGPFSLNQGNYQQGGLDTSSYNRNNQQTDPIFRVFGRFGTPGSSPGGLISGQNTGGPLDFSRGGQSEDLFGPNQGYYQQMI